MSDSEANNAPDESEQNSDPDYQEDQEVYRPTHSRKQRKRFSTVWNNFTILNAKEYHAECNICHSRMSYRTTVTNLKKHLIRKHNYDCSVIPHKSKNRIMSDSEANKLKVEDESEQHSDPDYEEVYTQKPSKPRKKSSSVWNNFTILNAKEYLAKCNICHIRMSYRTITNMKKHLIRKHNYDCSVIPHKSKERTITPTPRRPNLTEMGGLEGMLLDIAGEDGERLEEQNMENVEERVVYRDVDGHDYCIMDGTQVETQAEQEGDQTTTPKITGLYSYSPGINRTSQETSITKPQPTNKFQERFDRNKRNRLMDLQLGCLEIKKYNMQMEALMLEHQLNLPRSIHTETLRRSDTMTRSTQTEVGGNNTKVFYVSDNGAFRDSSQNFFTFQARLDDN